MFNKHVSAVERVSFSKQIYIIKDVVCLTNMITIFVTVFHWYFVWKMEEQKKLDARLSINIFVLELLKLTTRSKAFHCEELNK